MSLLKIKKNSQRTAYELSSDIDEYILISYSDIVNLSNIIVDTEERRQDFKIDIRTSDGDYSFGYNELTEDEYKKLLNSKIEKIHFCVDYYSIDSIYFNIYFYKKGKHYISVEMSDEIAARGMYGKIRDYVSKCRIWYNIAMKIALYAMILSIALVILLPSISSKFDWLNIVYIVNMPILAILFLLQLFVPRSVFAFAKSNGKFLEFLKNPTFWSNIITAVVTFLATYFANKH